MDSGPAMFKDEIDMLTESPQTAQVYTYDCDFPNNAIAFRNRKDNKFQLAVASFETESMNNKVEIVDLSLQSHNSGFTKVGEFQHEFPPTKMMWIPTSADGNPDNADASMQRDLLATTAECLRVWERVEDPTGSSQGIFKENKISRNVSTFESISCFD